MVPRSPRFKTTGKSHAPENCTRVTGAMEATKPYKVIGLGAVDATKPYTCIGFGTMDATKPFEFIGFGAMGINSWMAQGFCSPQG